MIQLRALVLVLAAMAAATALAACGGKDGAAGSTPADPSKASPAPRPTFGPQDPSALAAWAEGHCKALQAYAGIAAQIKPIPIAIPFEQEQPLYRENAALLLRASETALLGLLPLKPTPAAQGFHEANLRSMQALQRFAVRAVEKLGEAKIHEELEAVTLEQRFNLQSFQETAIREGAALNEEVTGAMQKAGCNVQFAPTPTAQPG